MAVVRIKNFDHPDEVRDFGPGVLQIVRVGDLIVGRTIAEPGFRWSEHIKPLAGTPSCEVHHRGLLFAGRFRMVMDDGRVYDGRPGDVFDIPPGHDAWVVGRRRAILVDFLGEIGEMGRPRAGGRVLATLLFTDIVGSTAIAERVGDARWKALLEDHDRAVRAELSRYRGHEVKTTGDGFLATFDGAERAIRCAIAIRDRAKELGLAIRAGIHTGEVELVGEDVRGVAVHATARIMALAEADEILVSATTHDFVAGTGLVFEDRGAHELKGLTGPRRLFLSVGTADTGERQG